MVFTYLKSRSRYAGKTDMKLSNSSDINIFPHILETNIQCLEQTGEDVWDSVQCGNFEGESVYLSTDNVYLESFRDIVCGVLLVEYLTF